DQGRRKGEPARENGQGRGAAAAFAPVDHVILSTSVVATRIAANRGEHATECRSFATTRAGRTPAQGKAGARPLPARGACLLTLRFTA
ncbi:hypothetical protein, partial [Escherichia coli]|uniref:hypothetical protein n=1 Tax=Escherichia coli TaxID=562 RepID=UPI0019542713